MDNNSNSEFEDMFGGATDPVKLIYDSAKEAEATADVPAQPKTAKTKQQRHQPGEKRSRYEGFRTNIVYSRMDDAELAELDRKRGKLTRGAFVRKAIQGKAIAQIPAINQELYASISKGLSNLNQLTRAINGKISAGKDITPFIDTIKAVLKLTQADLIGAKAKSGK